MKMTRTLILIATLMMCALSVSAAWADGAVVGADGLEPQARASLEREVAAARAQDGPYFEAVAELHRALPMLEQRRRGPHVLVGPILRDLGPQALMPMLEQLALDSLPQAGLAPRLWLDWQVGLIETVGKLRDPRAVPVLVAALAQHPESHELVRATAEALGRIGTDEAIAPLVAAARMPGPHQLAVLQGMGDGRREAVAKVLVEQLAASPDDALAQVLIGSLQEVGNLGAWKTEVVARSGEGEAVRSMASRALVTAFIRYEGHTRQRAATALLTVLHPSTVGLLEAARREHPALAVEIDRLIVRFERFAARVQF